MLLLCTNCQTPDPNGMRAAEFTCAACGRIEAAAKAIWDTYLKHDISPDWMKGTTWLQAIKLAESNKAWSKVVIAAYDKAKAALDAALGDLFVIVPREPTEAMLEAGTGEYWKHLRGEDIHDMKAAYRAMIAASEGGAG